MIRVPLSRPAHLPAAISVPPRSFAFCAEHDWRASNGKWNLLIQTRRYVSAISPISNLVVRRIAPIRGKIVASPAYVEAHGAPKTLEDLLHHEALMQETEPWRLMSNGKAVTVRVHGRFKADNGEALVAAALAGIGISMVPIS